MLGPFLRWSGVLGLSVETLQGLRHPFILWYERWACMKPLQGKFEAKTQSPSHIPISWVDLGYTNLFCIPEVTSVFFSCCGSVLGDSLQDNKDATGGDAGGQASLNSWQSYIGIPINFHKVSGIVSFWSSELSAPLAVSKGCEALCPEEVENYGFLYSLHRGFGHPFIMWDEIWTCI